MNPRQRRRGPGEFDRTIENLRHQYSVVGALSRKDAAVRFYPRAPNEIALGLIIKFPRERWPEVQRILASAFDGGEFVVWSKISHKRLEIVEKPEA